MPVEQPCVLVGRDVFAYTIQPFGQECNPGGGTTTPFSLMGRWRNVTFEVEFQWATTTASSAYYVTRRLTGIDFRVTLENLVEQIGSMAMAIAVGNNLVKVVFQESSSGGVISCIGGIQRTSYKGQREEFTDTLELQCAGDVMGDGLPFSYVPASTTMEAITRGDGGLRGALEIIHRIEEAQKSASGKKEKAA